MPTAGGGAAELEDSIRDHLGGGWLGISGAPLPPLPAERLGRYRHYKGGEYGLVGVVRHSETLEPLVLYRALYGDAGLWVRPHAMFFETIVTQGRARPRFEFVG